MVVNQRLNLMRSDALSLSHFSIMDGTQSLFPMLLETVAMTLKTSWMEMYMYGHLIAIANLAVAQHERTLAVRHIG
jgi:hypothetical protein